MPDGTVPSSTEALRAALSAARASLQRQLHVAHTDAAAEALRQVQSALSLLPGDVRRDIPEIEWVDAEPLSPGVGDAKANGITPSTVEAAAVVEAVRAVEDEVSRRDDLTRIRGIDDTLAKRLSAIGIQKYQQMAAWQPDDVRTIADAMGLGRRFLALGIVEQAAQLERERVEANAKRHRAPVTPTASDRQSVAIWAPSAAAEAAASTVLVRAPSVWKPLAGDDLRAARTSIKAGQPVNSVMPLSRLVPSLDVPIYIATDYDAAIELPRWRTGVLVPFVEPRGAPDLTRLSSDIQREMPRTTPAPRRTQVPAARVVRPLIEETEAAPVEPAIGAPTEPPLHVMATNRINDLEAALEFLAAPAKPPVTAARVVPASVEPAPPSDDQKRAAPVPGTKRADARRPTFEDEHAEEAEVQIVIGQKARAPLLAPLPDLPLVQRPPRTGRDAADTVARRPGSLGVEEAAVVIVRRTTAKPAAEGLAFYANATKAAPAAGPVRRFMRALAGA